MDTGTDADLGLSVSGSSNHARRQAKRKPVPFRELTWFAIQALDKIYNESPKAREAVIKHYGLYHHPYNNKFKRFQRNLRLSRSEVCNSASGKPK